jgi:undecaprenyl-diphosphatase
LSFLQAILLGIVQGLTEFLPISSSAHLVLVPYFLGWQLPERESFIFNVLVQNGTLVAVIVYFWKDLIGIAVGFFRGIAQRRPFQDAQARLGWYLILATIPAGIFGLTAKDLIESAFNSVLITAIFLFVTAGLLLLVEWAGKRQRTIEQVNWKDALIVGSFQVLAVFPGVSRSGATIAGGMARNLERPAAARFAFLISIPIMLAAGMMETIELLRVPDVGAFLPVVAAGFIASAVVGYFAIRWLISFLIRHSLRGFAFYCIALGTITLITVALRG